MVAQYYAHVDGKIDITILEAIVKRIYRAKMPSIVQSLVVVFSRFLNLFPKEILKFLTSIQVENRVGLKVLIDKWLLHQPLFRGSYYINVSIKALTILFELKDNVVETLMVIGYDPSHSTASIEVNAPFKILSVLIRCYNNELLQEKVKKERNDYNNLIYSNNYLQNEDDDENQRLEVEADDFEGDDEMRDDYMDDDKKLDINTEEFKNIEEEPRDFNSKLNFAISHGNTGGLNNLEIGSEKYLSEMLVRYI
jgi:importin-9